jgi:hypothetical protein
VSSTRSSKPKGVLELVQDDLARRFLFASRSDYQALGKRLSAIKRRIRDLTRRIEAGAGKR